MPIIQSAEGKVRGKGREEISGDKNEESETVGLSERPSGYVKRMEDEILFETLIEFIGESRNL